LVGVYNVILISTINRNKDCFNAILCKRGSSTAEIARIGGHN